ncbi:MAG: hypothetical protein HGA55_07385 [Methanoregulaceae archaeon]|nr:hypothetical protein [Methanoregulaceae archaeon]
MPAAARAAAEAAETPSSVDDDHHGAANRSSLNVTFGHVAAEISSSEPKFWARPLLLSLQATYTVASLPAGVCRTVQNR